MTSNAGSEPPSAGAAGEAPDVETSSADYARRFSGAVGEWFLQVQARTVLELLAPWPHATILDVGGGHAQLTRPLIDTGHALTVYGSRPVCAERLRPWLDARQASFASGPLLQAPFPDRSFDVVLAFRLLPHVAHWRDLAAELARLARHAVLVDYPTRRSVNAAADLLFGLKRRVEGNTRSFRVFADSDVAAAFGAAGFRATARRPQFFLPMVLHRALGLAPLSRGLEVGAGALGLTRVLGSPVILRLERVTS
jgi:2-polyprenyl-3-methyl-5-hydroxy-6-metoxy-1,4-benzoquinol methylase